MLVCPLSHKFRPNLVDCIIRLVKNMIKFCCIISMWETGDWFWWPWPYFQGHLGDFTKCLSALIWWIQICIIWVGKRLLIMYFDVFWHIIRIGGNRWLILVTMILFSGSLGQVWPNACLPSISWIQTRLGWLYNWLGVGDLEPTCWVTSNIRWEFYIHKSLSALCLLNCEMDSDQIWCIVNLE